MRGIPTGTGGGGANYGKLTKMRWSWDASAQPCALPGSNGTAGFEENYTYTSAGLVLSKTLSVSRNGTSNVYNLGSGYTYNNEGAMLTMSYPAHRETFWDPNVSNYVTADRSMVTTNTLGSLGRLVSFTATPVGGVSTPPTIASGAQYNHFSALTSLNVLGSTETRTYNVLGQLTRITGLGIDLEYTFSGTQNDGKITAQKNWVSGEEVAYQYDSLERLISAVTTGPQWGLSFSYDGFGNRLSQTVTKGTAPSNSVLVDGNTNRINSAGFVYDSNGNMTNMPTNTATLTYDASNRMTQYSGTNIQEAYAYAPDNKRIWRSNTMRGCEVPNTPGQSQPSPAQGDAVIFYSAHGLKLGVYCLHANGFQIASEQNLYFESRFVARVGLLRNVVSIGTDRLQSTQSQGGHFPYGEFKNGGATAQDKEDFGTYTRDRSGLDYADQRSYSSVLGRFTTSDPYVASASASMPQSWNRYPYVTGDPLNLYDPSGLFGQPPQCPVGTIRRAKGNNEFECISTGGGGGPALPNAPSLEMSPDYDPAQNQGGPTTDTVDGVSFEDYNNDGAMAENIRYFFDSLMGSVSAADPRCANWLMGEALRNANFSIEAYATDISGRIGTAQRITYGTSIINATSGGPKNGGITINITGAFYNPMIRLGEGSGSIKGGTQRAKAMILLHELAHISGAGGFASDLGNSAAGKRNNELVRENCARTLNSYAN